MSEEKERPLPGKAEVFIQRYLACRDVAEAARSARLKPSQGKRLYYWTPVYKRIRKLIDQEDQKIAELVGKSRALTVEHLDAGLVETIDNLEPSIAKVRAIELGYTRTGVLDKGSLIVQPPAPSAPQELPQIYTALQFRTVRRTTEEITEEKQVAITGQPAPKALPPGEDFEIFDLP